MKKLALMGLMYLPLAAADKYQVCGIMTQTGEVICGQPKTRQGAELAALAFNASSQGQFVAWVQRIPKLPRKRKPATPEVPSAPMASQPSTN